MIAGYRQPLLQSAEFNARTVRQQAFGTFVNEPHLIDMDRGRWWRNMFGFQFAQGREDATTILYALVVNPNWPCYSSVRHALGERDEGQPAVMVPDASGRLRDGL